MTFVFQKHGEFDWQYDDAVETLIVIPHSETEAGTPRPDVKGVREEPQNIRQIIEFASIGLEPGNSVFRIWYSTLNGYTPKNGDTIEDSDGQTWKVQAVTTRHTEPRFICLCITTY